MDCQSDDYASKTSVRRIVFVPPVVHTVEPTGTCLFT